MIKHINSDAIDECKVQRHTVILMERDLRELLSLMAPWVLIAIILASVWTARALWQMWQSRGGKTIEDLISELKKGAIVERRSVETLHSGGVGTSQQSSPQ